MPNLTTRITEAWTSGITGEAHAFDKTVTVADVVRLAKFEYQCATSAHRTLFTIDNNISSGGSQAGLISKDDFKYLRIKNYSASNSCELLIGSDPASPINSFTKKLAPLEVFEITNLAMEASDASGGKLSNGDTDFLAETFAVKGIGGSVNIEMIVGYA
tara:strand:+ start:3924 stop:4400 length:477 start_codon:yes stop_codon:yes gene_type:complete